MRGNHYSGKIRFPGCVNWFEFRFSPPADPKIIWAGNDAPPVIYNVFDYEFPMDGSVANARNYCRNPRGTRDSNDRMFDPNGPYCLIPSADEEHSDYTRKFMRELHYCNNIPLCGEYILRRLSSLS